MDLTQFPVHFSPQEFLTLGFPLASVLNVKTESKGPRTIMLLVYVGAGDSSNQPKIETQRQ